MLFRSNRFDERPSGDAIRMAPFLQTSLPYAIAGSRRALVDVRGIADLPTQGSRDENYKVYVMELFIAQRAEWPL